MEVSRIQNTVASISAVIRDRKVTEFVCMWGMASLVVCLAVYTYALCSNCFVALELLNFSSAFIRNNLHGQDLLEQQGSCDGQGRSKSLECGGKGVVVMPAHSLVQSPTEHREEFHGKTACPFTELCDRLVWTRCTAQMQVH